MMEGVLTNKRLHKEAILRDFLIVMIPEDLWVVDLTNSFQINRVIILNSFKT